MRIVEFLKDQRFTGTNGVVWRAIDELGRDVAVKFFNTPFSAIRDEVVRNAKPLASIDHPNVVKIYGIVDSIRPDALPGGEPEPAIVMEFVPGVTFEEWSAKPHRRAREVEEVLIGILDGLAALHGRGLAHGDLHGRNIRVSRSGVAKIIDPIADDPGIARSSSPLRASQAFDLRQVKNLLIEALRGTSARTDIFGEMCMVPSKHTTFEQLRDHVRRCLATTGPSTAPTSKNLLPRIPSFENIEVICRCGRDFCEAISATPADAHDSVNLALKATEAIGKVYRAFSPGVTPGGIQSIMSTGWPQEITQSFSDIYVLAMGTARSLGWQQLMQGYSLNLKSNGIYPWVTGERLEQTRHLAQLLEGLWKDAMLVQYGKIFMAPSTMLPQPMQPKIGVIPSSGPTTIAATPTSGLLHAEFGEGSRDLEEARWRDITNHGAPLADRVRYLLSLHDPVKTNLANLDLPEKLCWGTNGNLLLSFSNGGVFIIKDDAPLDLANAIYSETKPPIAAENPDCTFEVVAQHFGKWRGGERFTEHEFRLENKAVDPEKTPDEYYRDIHRQHLRSPTHRPIRPIFPKPL